MQFLPGIRAKRGPHSIVIRRRNILASKSNVPRCQESIRIEGVDVRSVDLSLEKDVVDGLTDGGGREDTVAAVGAPGEEEGVVEVGFGELLVDLGSPDAGDVQKPVLSSRVEVSDDDVGLASFGLRGNIVENKLGLGLSGGQIGIRSIGIFQQSLQKMGAEHIHISRRSAHFGVHHSLVGLRVDGSGEEGDVSLDRRLSEDHRSRKGATEGLLAVRCVFVHIGLRALDDSGHSRFSIDGRSEAVDALKVHVLLNQRQQERTY